MKKILALIAAGIFLAGCVSNAPKSAVDAPKSGKYSFADVQDGIRAMNLQGGVVQKRCVQKRQWRDVSKFCGFYVFQARLCFRC